MWRFLMIITILLNSCVNSEVKSAQIIKESINEKIIFPPLNAKIIGRDTLCMSLLESKYKMVVYVDSVGCTSCKLHLLDWHEWINKYKYYKQLGFIFIVSQKDYTEFEWQQKINQFDYPVFYDMNCEFNKLNVVSEDNRFHVFLLNEENRIMVIGDPIENPRMYKIYDRIISKLDK